MESGGARPNIAIGVIFIILWIVFGFGSKLLTRGGLVFVDEEEALPLRLLSIRSILLSSGRSGRFSLSPWCCRESAVCWLARGRRRVFRRSWEIVETQKKPVLPYPPHSHNPTYNKVKILQKPNVRIKNQALNPIRVDKCRIKTRDSYRSKQCPNEGGRMLYLTLFIPLLLRNHFEA
jgi:hypothetical protein